MGQRISQNNAGASGTAPTTNVDAGARTQIAKVLAIVGSTAPIQPGKGIFADGIQWMNETAADIAIPNPATEANMTAAGFTDVTKAGDSSIWDSGAGAPVGVPPVGKELYFDETNKVRYQRDAAGTAWELAPAGEAGIWLSGAGAPVGVPPAGKEFYFDTTNKVKYQRDAAGTAWELAPDADDVNQLFDFDTTGLEHVETPSVADFQAKIAATPTMESGDKIRITTPVGFVWLAEVYDDAANPGTLIVDAVEAHQPAGVEYDSVPISTQFAANHVIHVTGNAPGAQADAGGYRNNGAGNAWSRTNASTNYLAGGGGSSITVDSAISATSTNPVENRAIKAALDALTVGGVVIDTALSATSPNPLENRAINAALADKVDQTAYDAKQLAQDTAIGSKVDTAVFTGAVTTLGNSINLKADPADITSAVAAEKAARDAKDALQDTAIGNKVDQTVYDAKQTAQDLLIAGKVGTTAYDAKQATQDNTLATLVSNALWLAVATDPTGQVVPAGKLFAATPDGTVYEGNTGNWVIRPTITSAYDHTYAIEAGNAPAVNTLPASLPTAASRDAGDNHTIYYDDFFVIYGLTATVWAENIRRPINSASPPEVVLSTIQLAGAAPTGVKSAIMHDPATGRTIYYDVDAGGNYRVTYDSNLVEKTFSSTESPAPGPGAIRHHKGFIYERNTDAAKGSAVDASVVPDSVANAGGTATSDWIQINATQSTYDPLGTLPVAGTAVAEAIAAIGNKNSFRGIHDASGGAVPTPASSSVRTGEGILAGDKWRISIPGTVVGLQGLDDLEVDDLIYALIDDAAVAADFGGIQGNAEPALIEQGTDAERLIYTGPAIEWKSTDTQTFWDRVDDEWIKRSGAAYVAPQSATVTNAQLFAVFAALNTQKISDGNFSDTDVAAFAAAIAAAGL